MRTIPLRLSFVSWCVVATLLAGSALGAGGKPMKIWPNGAPGEKGDIGPEKSEASGTPPITRVSNVTEPTITLYRPDKSKANGCAVVICPGGGYNILAIDLEGTEVADWLNSIGVTAVILKYRVPRRDKDAPHAAPLQDVQRALRLVRKNAGDWGIDADRIGVLGFSAGGNLIVMAATNWDKTTYKRIDDADDLSCRPNFMVPIYAAYIGDKKDPTKLNPLVRVTKETPPAFLTVTWDDATRGMQAATLFLALKKAGVSAELHVFSKGGHGYGLRKTSNPVSGWPRLCEQWLRTSGWLTAKQKK